MSRSKPVSYDVVEGEDRFVLILRCVPLKGPVVDMEEVPGRGFEFRDREGGSIRFGNPHARMRITKGKAMILVMMDGDDIAIATTPNASPFDRGMMLIPSQFLWHHDRAATVQDYRDRPLTDLLDNVMETTAGVLCAPPQGAPVSACIHRRMAALAGDREWRRVTPKLLVDVGSLESVIDVAETVGAAVKEAFEPGGTPVERTASWRSQLAIRVFA